MVVLPPWWWWRRGTTGSRGGHEAEGGQQGSGGGGGGRWWVRCRSITTYRVAHRVPGERGFLDGDLLRQRRGSRDLATEVCTYHHHRVKRGLPVGGKRGLVFLEVRT